MVDEGSTNPDNHSPVSTPIAYSTGSQGSASSTPKTPSNPDAPTVEDDRRQLEGQLVLDIGRRVDVDKNPADAGKNGADWSEGRGPNDVVEVEGQRETVKARMARNGVSAL